MDPFRSLFPRADDAASSDGFIRYHEPSIIQLLVLISFFLFLSLGEWLSAKVFRAGLIGQIVVGLIYGAPIGNILPIAWQETFIALGYLGLILVIFEGGLQVRLDLLKSNFILSLVAATVGVVAPIGLSYLICYLWFGYGAAETFIIGAALSVTSLGTTFVVIGSASATIDFSQTKVGTVLVSAAVFDDVSGLVMASVVDRLPSPSSTEDVNLGWLIGRPILASGLMAILTPLLTKYAFAPIFRRYMEPHFPRHKHTANVLFIVLILSAFLSIAAFGGTSVLFGSFLAGSFLTYIPSKHADGPFVVISREDGEENDEKNPTFIHSFEKYFLDAQMYIMEPLFFASIGFATPFKRLWSKKAIWQGIVYSIAMLFAKVIVGFTIPIWGYFKERGEISLRKAFKTTLSAAGLLGFAMVARGEIGLLIIQIGLNNTAYLSEEAFITAVWAIVLNTIIGPVVVGLLVKFRGRRIERGDWGTQAPTEPSTPARSRRPSTTGSTIVVDLESGASRDDISAVDNDRAVEETKAQ